MGILIDTSVLIAQERGQLDVSARVNGREDEEFYLSAITASELLHGVERAADARRRSMRSAYVEAILRDFPVLPIDLQVSRAHAQIWAQLVSNGTMIGAHDLWIAATCISRGLTLVTFNLREFRRIDALQLEDWSN